MYNEAIASKIIFVYGILDAEKFCRMEAYKYELIWGSLPTGTEGKSEALYERDWWALRGEMIANQIAKNLIT